MGKKIKIAFMVNRETFRIEIENRKIWYSDRRWDRSIRLIPKDKEFLRKIILSRNRIPSIIKELFNLTKKEQEEYDAAETDEDLANLCERDCKMRGAILLKREVEQSEKIKETEEDGKS